MAETQQRRRWFRFSLRSLLIAVALLAMLLAWWANQAREQRAAIAALRKLAPDVEVYYSFQKKATIGDIDYDSDIASPVPAVLIRALGVDFFHSVAVVSLQQGREEIVAKLPALKRLKVLALMNPDVPAMDHLKSLQHLEVLLVSFEPETPPPQAPAPVSSFPILRWLFGIRQPPPPSPPPKPPKPVERKFARLNDLPALPALKDLRPIGDDGVTDLTNVDRFPQLETFDTYWSDSFTNRSLQELAKLPRLKKLDIAGPGVTDEGIPDLLKMTNLETLSITAANVTAAGLAKLKALPKLRELGIPAALNKDLPALNRALPNCTITVN